MCDDTSDPCPTFSQEQPPTDKQYQAVRDCQAHVLGVHKSACKSSNNTMVKDVVDQEEKDCLVSSPFLERMVRYFFPNTQPPVVGLEQALPSPPPPKQMLWGCETPEEHYQRIKEACSPSVIVGEERLGQLGFEFRMVHHPERCICGFRNDDDVDLCESHEDVGTEYITPLKEEEISERTRDQDTDDSDEDDDDDVREREAAFRQIKRLSTRSAGGSSSSRSWRISSRSTSVVSLFSLATHYSSSESLSGLMTTDNNNTTTSKPIEEEGCALRLCHIPSNSLVTNENFDTFVAKGKMYDKIAEYCMQYAQSIMMVAGNLQKVRVTDGVNAFVSQSRQTTADKRRKVLLIITGKGLVRAGIFSRKHLMMSSVEAATAIPFIREAVHRDMNICVLDPNANPRKDPMGIVESSLEQLFPEREEEEVYVVAHSMAGAQMVRILHKKAGPSAEETHQNHVVAVRTARSFQERITAIAFTDSNHNINWVKDNPLLTSLLVGPRSLYIKSHKHHESGKSVGEPAKECKWWQHRFGTVKTLWAGTAEHALTNYTARFHIWQHFDSFMEDQDSSLDDDEEEDEEGIPSF